LPDPSPPACYRGANGDLNNTSLDRGDPSRTGSTARLPCGSSHESASPTVIAADTAAARSGADRQPATLLRRAHTDRRGLPAEALSELGFLEWDDDTAASIASIEVVTRKVGDNEVEHLHRIKLWDKVKALEQLSEHLGLYRDQRPSEQPGGERPLSDLSDELYQRLLDTRVRLNRAIEHEPGVRCETRLLDGGKAAG
jgi:phage terminase small subunit